MHNRENCNFCHGKQFDNIPVTYLPFPYKLMRCKRCQFTILDPIPFDITDEKKGEGGSVEYDLNRNLAIQKVLDFQWDRIKRHCIKFDLDRPLKILDLGCGIGSGLLYLREKGHRVTGVEVNEDQANYGIQKYGLDINKTTLDQCGFPDELFDMVISLHTFEHLTDPLLYFRECYRLLKKGGILSIDVPNYAFAGSRFEKYAKMDKIVGLYHLNYFEKNTLSMFLENSGFIKVYFGYGLWGYPIINRFARYLKIISSLVNNSVKTFVRMLSNMGIRRNLSAISIKPFV